MSTMSTIGPAGARTAPAGRHEPALPVPLDAAVPPTARPADLAVAGALLGVVALLPLPAPVRAVFLAGFVGSAPGSAILSWVSVPIRARAGVIPVLGMSAMTIITLGAMWSYRWHPTGILTTTVVAVLVSSGLCYRKNGWPERIRPTASWRTIRVGPSVLMSIGALAIWGASLPGLPGVDASLYGLLFSGTGPMLAVAILITALGFVVAIRARNLPAAVFALGTAIAAVVAVLAGKLAGVSDAQAVAGALNVVLAGVFWVLWPNRSTVDLSTATPEKIAAALQAANKPPAFPAAAPPA